MHEGYESVGKLFKFNRNIHMGIFDDCPVCQQVPLVSTKKFLMKESPLYRWLKDREETKQLREFKDMWE